MVGTAPDSLPERGRTGTVPGKVREAGLPTEPECGTWDDCCRSVRGTTAVGLRAEAYLEIEDSYLG